MERSDSPEFQIDAGELNVSPSHGSGEMSDHEFWLQRISQLERDSKIKDGLIQQCFDKITSL